MNKLDGFDKRELVGDDYWKDERWKEVQRLRNTGDREDALRANGLVMMIRSDWGVD